MGEAHELRSRKGERAAAAANRDFPYQVLELHPDRAEWARAAIIFGVLAIALSALALWKHVWALLLVAPPLPAVLCVWCLLRLDHRRYYLRLSEEGVEQCLAGRRTVWRWHDLEAAGPVQRGMGRVVGLRRTPSARPVPLVGREYDVLLRDTFGVDADSLAAAIEAFRKASGRTASS